MRLLMTTDTVGGVWTYNCDLAGEMLGRGHEVMLVLVGRAPSPSQTAWIETARERWGRGLTTRRVDVPLEWMADGGRCYEDSAAEMLALCAEFAPDVFHCNQFCYGRLPVGAMKVVVAHSDVLSWWEARYGEEMPASAWRARYCELVSAGLAGADVVVAPTGAAMRDLRRHFNVHEKARVIANGRTTRCSSLRDAEVLGGKRMQAVTCGRVWDEGKNVHLLEAMCAPMPILIAGEQELSAEETGAAAPCTPNGRTRYLGALSSEALDELMRESAIYVVTSRYEPFGLAAVEAALAGCAVVANDLASQREVWGDAAVFFAKDDAGGLERLLSELAGDAARVRRIAAACRRRALECFPASRMGDAYATLYEKMLADRRRGAERDSHAA